MVVGEDQSARFRDLYVRFYEPVHSFLRRRADEETARDVAANTFLVAWRRLDAVPQVEPLPWLIRTARLTLANEIRRDNRRKAYARRAQADVRYDAQVTADLADSVAETERIRLALLDLPSADAEILRLTAWEDLDTRQVAMVLGCTVAAAKVRLHRARRKLAVLLDDPTSPRSTSIPHEVRS